MVLGSKGYIVLFGCLLYNDPTSVLKKATGDHLRDQNQGILNILLMAPVDMENIPVYICRVSTSQVVVWDGFHQHCYLFIHGVSILWPSPSKIDPI